MPYQNFICDVFTNNPFKENQLAFLPEADGLNSEKFCRSLGNSIFESRHSYYYLSSVIPTKSESSYLLPLSLLLLTEWLFRVVIDWSETPQSAELVDLDQDSLEFVWVDEAFVYAIASMFPVVAHLFVRAIYLRRGAGNQDRSPTCGRRRQHDEFWIGVSRLERWVGHRPHFCLKWCEQRLVAVAPANLKLRIFLYRP